MSTKEIVTGLLERLPEDVSLREVARRIEFIAAVREGFESYKREGGASTDEEGAAYPHGRRAGEPHPRLNGEREFDSFGPILRQNKRLGLKARPHKAQGFSPVTSIKAEPRPEGPPAICRGYLWKR